ncbi:hypothetical protein C8J56DRAFT_1039414 [Mycena floridula]|nr:hypothetical protein C8J56DRAFT_1039414 [Mycena floridula]
MDAHIVEPSNDENPAVAPVIIQMYAETYYDMISQADKGLATQSDHIRALHLQANKHKDVIDGLVKEVYQLTNKLDIQQEPLRIQQLEQQHEEDLARIAKLKRINARL